MIMAEFRKQFVRLMFCPQEREGTYRNVRSFCLPCPNSLAERIGTFMERNKLHAGQHLLEVVFSKKQAERIGTCTGRGGTYAFDDSEDMFHCALRCGTYGNV